MDCWVLSYMLQNLVAARVFEIPDTNQLRRTGNRNPYLKQSKP